MTRQAAHAKTLKTRRTAPIKCATVAAFAYVQASPSKGNQVKKQTGYRMARIAGLLALLLPVVAASSALTVQIHDGAGAPVPQAVVSLTPDSAAPAAAARAKAVMDQRNLVFVPQVLVVQAGTTVDFPNSDNVRHQVYSFSPAKKFQISLYTGNHGASELFDKPGVVTLGCNIHDWMLGYIVVTDTPYFGQSSATGQLEINNVPPGHYTLTVWHPRLKPGQAPRSEPVDITTAPLQKNITLSLREGEQTNTAPSGLEVGLGDRLGHEAHGH